MAVNAVVTRQSNTLEAVQQSLFAEDFDLSDTERAFAEEYLTNGERKRDAILAVRPEMRPGAAAVKANRFLKRPEILRYLDWRRAQLVLRAQLREDELVEKSRRVYLHGVGEMRLRKSVVSRDEDGALVVEDISVFEPSLTAANAAVEQMRKLGGFGGGDGDGDGDGVPSVSLTLNMGGRPAETDDSADD